MTQGRNTPQRASPPSPAWRALITLGFVVGLVLVGRGLLDAVQFIGRPFPNFGFTRALQVNPVLFAPSETAQAEVALWDQIQAFNGAPLRDVEHFKELLAATGPEGRAELTLTARDGRPKQVRITVRAFTVADFFRWHTNQTLLALIIIIIGAVVWLLRAGALALTFCLTCLCTALMLTGGVDGTLFHRFPLLFQVAAPIVPAAGMAFAWRLSPRLHRRRHGALAWQVPLSAGVLLAALGIFFEPGPVQVTAAMGVLVYVFLMAGALGVFVVLWRAWRRPEGPLDAARAGVIVVTWPLALGIPAANFLFGFLARGYELTAIPNVAVLLMPASVAYAIFRQDLFEADLAVRRLFAELLLTGVATALYATALALAYRFWPDAAASPAVAVALAATLLFFAVPIRDRVKSNVDAWLEGRRYDAQQALASLAQALSAELSLERALARLEDTLQHTIGPANASVQLEDEGAAPTVTTIHGAAMPAVQSEVLRDSALVLRRSIFTAGTGEDEEPPDGEVRVRELPEGVEVAIPLRAGGRQLGALLLGPSSGGPARYSPADLLFARAVAGQVGPALANARAFDLVEQLNRTLEERVRERTLELTQVNDELRALDRRKDELISTVSHDFRSPLSIIKSHIDTVLADSAMDAPTRESFLRVVERQTRRLQSMVENLLDLARIRNRGLSAARLTVTDLLKAAGDGARPRFESAKVTLRVELPPGAPAVMGDADRLGQVFHNLLDNASRFTAAGGEVCLYAREAVGTITFGVRDNGIGIPTEDQARIFEPFYQVKRAGAERDGSGLGLAIVKEVVERHGSRLRLHSDGNGTTLEFDLPCKVA